MELLDELIACASATPLRRGGSALLSRDDALSVVRAAEARGIRILGIDGFEREGDRLRPALDAILDLSVLASGAQCVNESVRFLHSSSPQLWFELVVGDEQPEPE